MTWGTSMTTTTDPLLPLDPEPLRALIEEVRGLSADEIYERLGAIEWVLSQGVYPDAWLARSVDVNDIRTAFPALPDRDQLIIGGRASLTRLLEALIALLCGTNGRPTGRLGMIRARIVSWATEQLVAQLALHLAAMLIGGAFVIPAVAVLAASLLATLMEPKVNELTCAQLSELLEQLRR